MSESAEYHINFDISKLDAISKIVLKEVWLKPLNQKLKDLCLYSNDRYGFNYKIKDDKLCISIKAPEKSIDGLTQRIVKSGTDIIKGLTQNQNDAKKDAYERKT